MKKVGIILGIVTIVIVVVIFLIANSITNKKEVESVPPTNVVEEVPVEPTKDVVPEVVTPEPAPEVIVETVIKEVEVSGVKTIDESALENASEIKEVVTVISEKRVMLVDEEVGESSGKMLTYCFDVLTPNNRRLVLFVTKSVYGNYSVGDKLNVTYLVYTNDNGIEFPIVYSVTAVS